MIEKKRYGGWELGKKLGRGGSGLVYRARAGDVVAAIKLLHRPERVERFKDEVECMDRLAGTRGVLPVLDRNIPDRPTKLEPAWFAMPLATPLSDALGRSPNPRKVVSALRDIAAVLTNLHAKGFSHRDIKPDNLFRYQNEWVVGDFGLVEFEGKKHETALGERIGAIHFIAPEMLLGVPGADGKAADVYSLAKTLWVLLTDANFPVPGAYSAISPICQLKSYVTLDQSTRLDRLIEQSTTAEVDPRPSMSTFEGELSAWLKSGPGEAIRVGTALLAGDEWAEVAEASQVQELSNAANAKRHAEMHATLKKLYERMLPLYLQLREHFKAVHLSEISGPDNNTSPPGVIAWFPVRSTSDKRIALDFRVWFNFDWEHPERNLISALAIAKLNIQQANGTPPEELYRYENSFLQGGLIESNFIEQVSRDATQLLGSWLEKGKQRWISLG